jgi:GntR family transcriptional regulator
MHPIARELLKKVSDEQFKAGESLPKTSELANQYQTDADDVQQALGELIYEGVIERDPANPGTYRVPSHTLWGTITGNHSVTKEAKKRGMAPGVQILKFEIVPSWPAVRERLQLEPEDEVILMERLRLADDVPVQIEYSYMPAKLYPGANQEMFESKGSGQSSFKVMQEKFGLKSDKAVDEVTVATVEKREADLLGLEVGTPVLMRFRVTLSDKGVPIKGSRAIYKFKAGYELGI